MAYSEAEAYRIREVLADVDGVTERKMFGGLAFMVKGHMCCGLNQDHLMVRVGADQYEDSLAQPHAREMDFTGRPMRGIVIVDPPGYETAAGLRYWIDRGLAFVTTLPPK